MEIKSLNEIIDNIAILQKKVENIDNNDFKKDFEEAITNLKNYIKNNELEKEVISVETNKKSINLTAKEFIDLGILTAVAKRLKDARGIETTKEFILSNAIKDDVKVKGLLSTTEMNNWIPTEFIPNVIDLIIANNALIKEFIENIFRWSTGSNKREYPYIDAYATDFYAVEGATITSNNYTPPKFSLTAKPFKGMFEWTDEADMNTVVEMLPILRNALITGLSMSIEYTMINGDTTLNTTTVLKNFDGIRKLTLANNMASDMSTFNITNFRALRQKLKNFGIKPDQLLIVADSQIAYWKFLNDSNFLTIDKVGDKATILTGVIGIYDGIQLRVTDNIPLTNSSGQIDSNPVNNTKGSFIILNKRPFAVGFFGNPIIEIDRDITKGINYLVLREYVAFTSVYNNKGAVYGYNISL